MQAVIGLTCRELKTLFGLARIFGAAKICFNSRRPRRKLREDFHILNQFKMFWLVRKLNLFPAKLRKFRKLRKISRWMKRAAEDMGVRRMRRKLRPIDEERLNRLKIKFRRRLMPGNLGMIFRCRLKRRLRRKILRSMSLS